MNYYTPPYYQNFPQQNPPLNGKFIDNVDVVKATEIPLGGYGIFPKADFSSIFLKTWGTNGSTSIVEFKPIDPPPQLKPVSMDDLLAKISIIENKMDEILNKNSSISSIRKREASASDY